MININLLPESMRKKETMPLSHILATLGMAAVLALLVHFITQYYFDTIPTLQSRIAARQREKATLTQQVEELKKINTEIDRMNAFVSSVKGLYKGRTVWAKILSDLKGIANFDPTISQYNPDMRYLWFKDLNGKEDSLTLNAFATASTQVVAMQMGERLLEGLRSYTPVTLPEKDEEERLTEELRRAVAEHEAERRDRPDLPMQGPRELTIRQRLEEIKTIKSGGIALLPFEELLVKGSIQLKNAAWTAAPLPKGFSTTKEDPGGELFPRMAWTFALDMKFKK